MIRLLEIEIANWRLDENLPNRNQVNLLVLLHSRAAHYASRVFEPRKRKKVAEVG